MWTHHKKQGKGNHVRGNSLVFCHLVQISAWKLHKLNETLERFQVVYSVVTPVWLACPCSSLRNLLPWYILCICISGMPMYPSQRMERTMCILCRTLTHTCSHTRRYTPWARSFLPFFSWDLEALWTCNLHVFESVTTQRARRWDGQDAGAEQPSLRGLCLEKGVFFFPPQKSCSQSVSALF